MWTFQSQDSSWMKVDVPHDFVVAGNFTSRADKSHGYLPYGVAWYRRNLCLPEAAAIKEGSRSSWLEFEGVMVKSKAPRSSQYISRMVLPCFAYPYLCCLSFPSNL